MQKHSSPRRFVVCKGATEVGFLRGFDDHQVENEKDPLSFHGVALLDVRGAQRKASADRLEELRQQAELLTSAASSYHLDSMTRSKQLPH